MMNIKDIRHRNTEQSFGLRLLLLMAMVNLQCSIFNFQSSALHAQSTDITNPTSGINIGGNVYGGGNKGEVEGDTEVLIKDGVISGNVYGAGNEANMTGSTSVTILKGTIKNVFGGARMADVGGRAFVNIDGETGTGRILISAVYGGNDISGIVGTSVNPNDTGVDKVPTEILEDVGTAAGKNNVNNSWNVFVRTKGETDPATENLENCVIVGSLFGGGNGDYSYSSTDDLPEAGYTTHYIYEAGNPTPIASKVTLTGEAGFVAPTLSKTYLELNGGCMSQVYGGGNLATVTDRIIISMDNPSKTLQELLPGRDQYANDADYRDALMTELALLSQYTGIPTFQGDYSSLDYTSSRVFGGNNKEAMAIHPEWNLKKGKIRDLYSGGNQGDMTNTFGLLLEIPASSHIKVENVYGGCRRADVHPAVPDEFLPAVQLPADMGYHFPAGYSARVVIKGGDVRNVYGGNDISGNVYGGSAVGIYTSIRGDVYGAGNGSYAYTDNSGLKDLPGYGDFYYDVNSILGNSESTVFTEAESAQALLIHRPNAERVSLRLWGPSADNPTIIGGSVYVGGNSASLRNDRIQDEDARGELKIGSHVIADNVFLGNNGERMVATDILEYYHNNAISINESTYDYSKMVLTNSTTFSTYMDGCASFIKPKVVYDNESNGDPDTYTSYTTYFGSFYCGGNIGSMRWPGTAELNFDREVVIYNKLVGGCNNAYVPVHHVGDDSSNGAALNAEYRGGILGTREEEASAMVDSGTGKIGDAVVLNLSGFKIEPRRWVINRNDDYTPDLSGGLKYLSSCGNSSCLLSTINEECTHGGHAYLEWNTYNKDNQEVAPQTTAVGADYITTDDDLNRRFHNGNIYGGCYSSGIVVGNVVINVDSTLVDRDRVFDKVAQDELGEAVLYGETLDDILNPENQNHNITERRTGVILDRQGMDVLGKALNIFGGGYGADTEIWGSTTINLNAGYVFQIFGGGEKGVIGRSTGTSDDHDGAYDESTGVYTFNKRTYVYNDKYSCTVNVRGTKPGVSKQDDSSDMMSMCEFIYGGSFMAPICGNTIINLGNGRVFNTFAGSCMADILGHTETYMGIQVNKQSEPTGEGFPYVRDYIYCGNDLGGKILGVADFASRVRTDAIDDGNHTTSGIVSATTAHTANVTTASAYVEYRQGRAEGIFGGCFGTYDYKDPYFGEYFYATGSSDISASHPAGSARNGYSKPRMNNAFVNFRPTLSDALLISSNKYNFVNRIYGAGQGYPNEADRDLMQKSSYVLIDIPQTMPNYENMEVFGAGAWSGLGMYDHMDNKTAAELAGLSSAQQTAYSDNLDAHSAIIDLVRGQVGAAYGGSYSEGVTRRTMVNVPEYSTIRIGSIFGGAYGTETYMPCDVYEGNVQYSSANAVLIYDPQRTDEATGDKIGSPLHNGAIYGGNNNERRTLYTHVNIDARVNQDSYLYGMTRGNVFGAGRGSNTWAEYTEVNMNNGSEAYEVYGGGQDGKVFCAEAVTAYKRSYRPTRWDEGTYKAGQAFTDADWENAWTIGDGYDAPDGTPYWNYTHTNLTNPLVRTGEIDDRDWSNLSAGDRALIDHKYNTNVIIKEGAYVANYAYAAGLGADAIVGGHTYVALLGGVVNKDIYAGGTSGPVEDTFSAGNYTITNNAGFEATTTAYVKGGTVRNVYGGGWRGNVGLHIGDISESRAQDIPGQSHVVIGDVGGTSYTNGIPSITRNVYGGGEGGSIWGTAYVKINNGYIGYRYNSETDEYDEELQDVAPNDLDRSGNVFGGGYVANSYVDFSEVDMYGGTVRGSVFGGGEVGPIGRGTVKTNPEADIYKAGKTLVTIYDGHVMRNVFGGGRGYDNWGGEGWMSEEERETMDLSSKGFIFGRTQVFIRGGEIGSRKGIADGFGNVFGGCDRGSVYGAYGDEVVYFTQDEIDEAQSSDPAYGKTTSDIKEVKVIRSKKAGDRFDGDFDGFYYKHDGTDYLLEGTERLLSEDCKVVVGPQCQVKAGKTLTLTNVRYPYKAPISPVDIKYLKENNLNPTYFNDEGVVTEEDGITIPSRTYQAGDYVPTYALQMMGNTTDSLWLMLDDKGVIIHNAVFAGGNISAGDDQAFANTPTVFGNATASIHDLYHRDLVTIGGNHIGGLYGDGNLTLVDGYRGLNITNYGTDFYNLDQNIDLATYEGLPEREKAYYELKYVCTGTCTDRNGKEYEVDDEISYSDLLVLFEETDGENAPTNIFNTDGSVNTDYWQQKGVLPLYAGRIMNTIQRADFCGVWGSRMVMQGAPDRVPEVIDYNNYTINRVREVSLNKKVSLIDADSSDPKKKEHGNYFGIYSVVNFLGNLTSDVDMEDVRVTENDDYPNDSDNQTYVEYKARRYTDSTKDKRTRNRGSSHNKVALASGVFLELVSEISTSKELHEKSWGYITGVIELDLINVQTGVGGGYVYAKNVHGQRTETGLNQITLTALNEGAVTRKHFRYSDDATTPNWTLSSEWQTSGNFVHDGQTIIDDCYDIANNYKDDDRSPAHFWYIKGEIYVYEQYISAYTGAPSAYKESVNIPLTITAQSHGKLTLLNVQPNYYAYYKNYPNNVLGVGDKIEIAAKSYELNDPIDHWTYSQLSASEQALFVPVTYTTIAECSFNGTTYPAGTVMLPGDETNPASGTYNYLKAHAPKKDLDGKPGTPDQPYVHNNETNEDVDFDFVFRLSNNISHDTGYILTFDMTNPMVWNDWYTPKTGASDADKINTRAYELLSDNVKADYHDGPTYRVKSAEDQGVYGQREYDVSNIIDQGAYNSYQTMATSHSAYLPAGQAEFEAAYIVTVDEVDAEKLLSGAAVRLHEGATLAKSEYTTGEWPASLAGKVDVAYVSTTTIDFGGSDILYAGDVMTLARKNELIDEATAANNTDLATTLTNSIVPAYYCTRGGLYGGTFFAVNTNYRGLDAWSAMSPEDRSHFTYNYDALDLLIDPTYGGHEGEKYQYDDLTATIPAAIANQAKYSLPVSLDYTATYNNEVDELTVPNDVNVTRNGSPLTTKVIQNGDVLLNDAYESLPNEQYHYAPIVVPEGGGNIYVVKEGFVKGDNPYAVGETISLTDYNALGDNAANIEVLTFTEGQGDATYYYCRSAYQVGENGEGTPVTDFFDSSASYALNATVPVGIVITESQYVELVNTQIDFNIQGVPPVQTSTLYVSRTSDIFDLSKEKIITVVYKYDYEESDANGHITPVSERHIVNIHLQFKSGVPTVDDIVEPDVVLPGTTVVITSPTVTPGAYEIIGGGWEIYRTDTDAENHTNGIPYSPAVDPLYWYQNGYYVAYYAKTYLGKTFSNHVPVSVANYHDLKKVLEAKDHHYYVDNADVKRDPKIYINNYTTSDPATSKNALDLLADFFELTQHQKTFTTPVEEDEVPMPVPISNDPDNKFYKHVGVETSMIGDCKNLEFILRTDINHSESWTPIGDASHCFEGILHGDGYTISGLNNSLFSHLCGEVYNLGVTGTFTSAGLANDGTGFVENCWVKSDDNTAKAAKPVFNNPTNSTGTSPRTVHIVNCYYPEENQYTDHDASATYGLPTEKPLQSFYDGEVAYDLNEFYLFKRYCDNNSSVTGNDYSYWKDVDGRLTLLTGHYENANGPYLIGNGTDYVGSYVESRFVDGDFVYADGTIPGVNKRYYADDDKHYPIWPGDYVFFGQLLTYGHIDGHTHQTLPSSIIKDGDHLPTASSSVYSNRVYRAPAYYRSLTMGKAYFNPHVVLAQTKKDDATVIAHKNMTAIDFTGGNGDLAGGYQKGMSAAVAPTASTAGLPERFYPPLLDDNGIFSLQNIDLTRNLLIYTGTTGGTGEGETPTAMQQTANVVSARFLDQAYEETNDTYHTVPQWDRYSDNVKGHWVQGNGSAYTAPRDHFLVDKQDFNAPIGYTFATGKRMWYQRIPDVFVNRTKGWDAVSLPFSPVIVTTDDKGEITHFYEGSTTHHEYWLREFKGNVTTDPSDATKATGDFNPMAAGTFRKDYTNTFLWDYYYSRDSYQDYNLDEYQKKYYDYYSDTHLYEDYPLPVGGTPYLIGMPGPTYYEFDLSGDFTPKHRIDNEEIPHPGKQTVTYASNTAATIAVSDTELAAGTVTYGGYTFRPNYLGADLEAGTFLLNDEGSSFEQTDASQAAVPFRPYFTYVAPSPAPPAPTRSIGFNSTQTTFDTEKENGDLDEDGRGMLNVFARKGMLVMKSTLSDATDVRVFSASGAIVAKVTVEPGQTLEVPIHTTGIYIVNNQKFRVRGR